MIVWDDLFQYVVFWGLFGLLHSLFATEKIKKIIPLKGRAFRLFYNFIAVVSFLIVLTQVPSIILILVKVR
ncbi:MAG: hypothetical protein ACC656_08285, partial [Candidatus Heimdallarchaeota archaeon]